MTNWIHSPHPEISVLWVKSYFIAVDALLAIPVWAESKTALAEIERARIIWKISEEEAQTLNDVIANESPHMRKFVEETLAERWINIKDQVARA